MNTGYITTFSVFLFLVRCLAEVPLLAANHSITHSDGEVEANIALNRAVYQSDAVDDDHVAHLITDGSTSTYWESKPGHESWVAVDLGTECSFDQVTLCWGEPYATAYRIQISDDGPKPTGWKDVYSTKAGKCVREEITMRPTTARHLRLLVSEYSTIGRGCVLSELEVFGDSKSNPPPSVEFSPRGDGSILLSGGNWKLQNAMFVDATPTNIAEASFDDSRWIPAIVPGTVLGSYFAAGAIPDPWYNDQMSQISEMFFSRNDFWYRSHFVIPTSDASRHIWLNFDGINWKAEIFLNGAAVGRIDGAFIRGRFDITPMARPGATNYLAVLIHRVAHPGPSAKKVTHKTLGSRTVNGDVLGYDSPTFVASAGWNWLPIVRGRNIGIWNEVRIDTSANVELVDPWVISDLPLSDTNHADLTVQTELRNNSATEQHGRLIGTIGSLIFSRDVTLKPEETLAVLMDKTNCPGLSISNPRLWWPNGYGEQPLYTLNLRFECDGLISDSKEVTFGIRKISYTVTNQGLTIFVNGQRILCRGGNWGMDEGMLNCDREGYNLRVRLHHDANLNMIRNWVGMVGQDAFYDACDRNGILIWDDFWLANPGDDPNPTDQTMFMANARDKIRRVRSHPSLALYCGRNEGMPPKELDAEMRLAVNELDGTRYYLPHSAAGAVTGFGPYDDQNPEWYFANRGRTFHSELGIVAVPTVESIRAMMSPENLWPINDMWAVHDYQSPRSDNYTKKIIQRYGTPTSIEDYCRKAQMLNLESAKAMYECLQARQGGGVLVWMTQAAWPALICQLYDYYFEPTAAYFGAKKGCEPLHIMWDCSVDVIKVANNTVNDLADLTAEASAYNLGGNEIWHQSAKVNLPATSERDCFAIERPAGQPVFFVKLALRQGKHILSDNFYWSSSKGGSCTNLNDLPRLKLPVTVAKSGDARTCRLAVQIKNPANSVALMIRLKVIRAGSGERVLPIFYEDNYISLLPGEVRTVSVDFAKANLAGEPPKLALEGWNVLPQEISIP